MAATYGRGEFAINLAPMLFPTSVAVDSANTSGTAADGTPIVTTAKPTIDGLSAITGFGNATWVTIVDETPGDPTFGQIIGGFDPSQVTLGQAIAVSSGNATNALGNFAIPITTAFGSDGLKTIKIITTDNAGSQSNAVTLTFTLQATDIVMPPPTNPPPAPTLALPPREHRRRGPGDQAHRPLFTGTTVIGTSITVTETWTDGPAGTQPITFTVPASAINTDGTFSFTSRTSPIPPPTSRSSAGPSTSSPRPPGSTTPTASAIRPTATPSSFQINNTMPAAVTDFRLNPASDTGIVGDNVTTDRTPMFIGTTAPGNTVELFVNGQPAVQSTAGLVHHRPPTAMATSRSSSPSP